MKQRSCKNDKNLLNMCYNLMCILSNLLTVFVILIMCQISDCSDRMNNVSTEDYLSMNRSRGDFSEIFPEKSLDSKIPGWLCHCYSSIYENESDIECRCEGLRLLRVPQRLDENMQRLTIASAGIKVLRVAALNVYASTLRDIMLTNLEEFNHIEPGAFQSIKYLRTIYISHASKLQHLSDGTFRGIASTLKTLRIIHCGLLTVPSLTQLSGLLLLLDLEGNFINKIEENSIQVQTEQLVLDYNMITYVDKFAFNGSTLGTLSFKGNSQLRKLNDLAFSGIQHIQELDLSSTSIETLPTEGLSNLEILRIQNTHSLKQIPSVYNFKNLQQAWLTHSFHCCAFKFPSRHDPSRHAKRLQHFNKLQEACKSYNNGDKANEQLRPVNNMNLSSQNKQEHMSMKIKRWVHASASHERSIGHGDFFYNSGNNDSYAMNAITGAPVSSIDLDNTIESDDSHDESFSDQSQFHESTANIMTNDVLEATCGNLNQKIIDIKCYPRPDELNPCEDVMGSNWLRGSVWVVVLLAVFGNVAVLVVLFSNRSDLTVPKFLMCHLSLADFCMGLFLLCLASIDIHSKGEYFNYAFDWQYGAGCKTAGFLTVFSSHLSIFTLTIITVERWFAITHAIYLNKRIKLKSATVIMICGWMYSILMASLPLFGISNYSSTSICLPMETRDSLDVAYLITVLGVNGFAFIVIVFCYARIYFSLGKETRAVARNASSGEMTVAKKMALLVFTNFACWAPIAFFGLTALAGYALIDVTKSKILLVFFYPLNSCANPYLYAILTAQYRRDLFLLLAKFGFCTQRAQQYKMTYSMPTNTIPMTLISKNSINGNSSHRRSRGSSEKGLLAPVDLVPVDGTTVDEVFV